MTRWLPRTRPRSCPAPAVPTRRAPDWPTAWSPVEPRTGPSQATRIHGPGRPPPPIRRPRGEQAAAAIGRMDPRHGTARVGGERGPRDRVQRRGEERRGRVARQPRPERMGPGGAQGENGPGAWAWARQGRAGRQAGGAKL